jgi:hypothetical protein
VAEGGHPLLPAVQSRVSNAIAPEGAFRKKDLGSSYLRSVGEAAWRELEPAAPVDRGTIARPTAAELREMDELCTQNMIENLDKILF